MDMANDLGVVNVTQQELAEKLGYSRATINANIKVLKQLGCLEETNKQGRYILAAEPIVNWVDTKFLMYLAECLESKESSNLSYEQKEYLFKVKYYKIVTNLGYDWREFEEKFAEELEKTFVNTSFCGVMDLNNCDKEILRSKVQKVKEKLKEEESEAKYVYCTNCCSPIKENWNFCNVCGNKVEKVEKEFSIEELDNMMEELENFNEKCNMEEESIENLSEVFIDLVNKSGLRYVESLLKKQYGALHKFYLRNLMEMSGMKEKGSRVDSSKEYNAINSGTMQILKKLQKVSELDGCFDEEIGVIVLDDGSQLGFIKGHIPKNMYLKNKSVYNLYLVDFYGRAEYLNFGLDEKPIDFYVKNGEIVVETEEETFYVREL